MANHNDNSLQELMDGYYDDASQELDNHLLWMLIVSYLLGVKYTVDSVSPSGSYDNPQFRVPPRTILRISNREFQKLYGLSLAKADELRYAVSEKQLRDLGSVGSSVRNNFEINKPHMAVEKGFQDAKGRLEMLGVYGIIESEKNGEMRHYIVMVKMNIEK